MFFLVAVTRRLVVRACSATALFSRGRFDTQMFLLGAAFLLLETRAVTQLSLLFGSTWIVNTSVFGGDARHGARQRIQWPRIGRDTSATWYALLALSLIGVVAAAAGDPSFELPSCSHVPRWRHRRRHPGLLRRHHLLVPSSAPAPIPRRHSAAISAAPVSAGMLENLSMLMGLKAVVMLALVFYLFSMLVAIRNEGGTTGVSAQPS